MKQEYLFLIHALKLGVFISFLYDILRIYRRLFPHGMFWVSAEDLFFWIYCAAEVFLLMHREGNGNLRWFAVMGAVLGMGAYLKLISPWFVKYSLRLLGPLVRTLGRKRRAVSEKIRHFLKKNLTSLFQRVKIRLQRCKLGKRGVQGGDSGKQTEETGVGGDLRKIRKVRKKIPRASQKSIQ